MNYIAECVRLISYNAAFLARGEENGKYISAKLTDILDGKTSESKEEQPIEKDEILDRVNAMLARMRGE
jgi:hypothetical protein